MVDLHCHLLPAIDDGPPDIETSLEMANQAVHDGIRTIVATPHVNLQYDTDESAIAESLEELREALIREGVELSVLPGAEIALARLPGLNDAELRSLCLGGSSCVLVESPYTTAGEFIEESVFNLQARGFRPLLAHPERCPEFQRDIERLERLVSRGAVCSLTAGSLAGQFGQRARRFAHQLLEAGLGHNLSSDAHDSGRRAPGLSRAFDAPVSSAFTAPLHDWLTAAVPAAILSDDPLPPRPPVAPRSLWRRLTAR